MLLESCSSVPTLKEKGNPNTGSSANYLIEEKASNLITASPDVLRGKHIGLLFGADWCPSCKSWLPHLIRFYNVLKPSNIFEVVYVPCDSTFEQYKRMVFGTPWYSMPFNNYGDILRKYKVRHLPCIVILRPDDTILYENATDLIRDSKSREKIVSAFRSFTGTMTIGNRLRSLFG